MIRGRHSVRVRSSRSSRWGSTVDLDCTQTRTYTSVRVCAWVYVLFPPTPWTKRQGGNGSQSRYGPRPDPRPTLKGCPKGGYGAPTDSGPEGRGHRTLDTGTSVPGRSKSSHPEVGENSSPGPTPYHPTRHASKTFGDVFSSGVRWVVPLGVRNTRGPGPGPLVKLGPTTPYPLTVESCPTKIDSDQTPGSVLP